MFDGSNPLFINTGEMKDGASRENCLHWIYRAIQYRRQLYEFRGTVYNYTRKNAQVVTNLQQTCSNAVPTTCQQDVFALLVPSLLTSCQRQVVNGLLTTCCKIVELNRPVTSCSNNLLSSCNSTSCQQVVSDNLVATW
jgi:hypothetical protein